MRRTLITLTALALVATGCGEASPVADETTTDVAATPTVTETPTQEPTEATETASATPTPSPTAEDDDAPSAPFDANTEDDSADGSGGAVTVTDVRVGSEADHDRVVFEVAGDGTPGWRIGYVDEAVEQGRGNTVELEGEAQLEVVVTNTGYPFDTGEEEYDGPASIEGAEVVTEVVFEGTFEGQTQAFVGTTSEQPFRARLDDDGNVVVEIWHTDVQ